MTRSLWRISSSSLRRLLTPFLSPPFSWCTDSIALVVSGRYFTVVARFSFFITVEFMSAGNFVFMPSGLSEMYSMFYKFRENKISPKKIVGQDRNKQVSFVTVKRCANALSPSRNTAVFFFVAVLVALSTGFLNVYFSCLEKSTLLSYRLSFFT